LIAGISDRLDDGRSVFSGLGPEHADKNADRQENEKSEVVLNHDEVSLSLVLSVCSGQYSSC
jgi:hypothetical protein